jgi:hypothetical protein
MWFRYSRKVICNAAILAVVAIAAPIIPWIVAVTILLILGLPAPDFDIRRVSVWLICIVAFWWAFLMIANVPRAYAYLQQFSVQKKGIARRLFGKEIVFPWENVTAVEKRIRPTFENYR